MKSHKVDSVPLDKVKDTAAGEANVSAIILKMNLASDFDKIFHRYDRQLNISVLERNVKLGFIIEEVSDNSFAAVDDVTARGIAVLHPSPRAIARSHFMVGAEVLGDIGDRHERAAVDHGVNTLDGSVEVLGMSGGPLNQVSQVVKSSALFDFRDLLLGDLLFGTA